VYGREYGGRDLTFEASGGLIHGTLVLQDRETDSYWPIMAGRSIFGKLAGTDMKELAVARKVRWRDWRSEYPDTGVLSVDGREHQASGYDRYFASAEGFRGLEAADRRLQTKAPVYAFRIDGQPFAVAHATFFGGRSFDVRGSKLFFHRSPNAPLFESTVAVRMDTDDCSFDAASAGFSPAGCATPLTGFDTFWYSWSLNNPETAVVTP